MQPVSVLTATYNHPQKLDALYESLKKQNDQNFSWIIVDDGSEQETKDTIDRIRKEAVLDVISYQQENGGKSRAINKGIDLIKEGTEFFVIVDDDERLYPDAITTIKRYYCTYRDSDCGVIHFNRKDEKGTVIANPYFDKDFFMSYQWHKSKGFHADGYLGYFTNRLGDNRFRVFEGEKYTAPSTLFMKVTRQSRLLWAGAVLGETEYLDGGITKQGRRLRISNPMGMIEYCGLMQENGASLKTRLAYSVQGYAYMEFVGDKSKIRKSGLIPAAKIPGKVLAGYWRRKYREQP